MTQVMPMKVLKAGSFASRIPHPIDEVVGIERTLSGFTGKDIGTLHAAWQTPRDLQDPIIHGDMASLSVLAPRDGEDSTLKVDM